MMNIILFFTVLGFTIAITVREVKKYQESRKLVGKVIEKFDDLWMEEKPSEK